jgi:outer membrane protein
MELTNKIKSAYYNYLSAQKVIAIYENTLVLAKENMRINERLVLNGKGLPSYVLRSQSEIEQINAHITDAKKAAENAALYFNFLLNRQSDSAIESSFDVSEQLSQAINLLNTESLVSERPEFKLTSKTVEIEATKLKMNRKFDAPKLNAFIDLGLQSQRLKFNNQSKYYFAGIQLSIPLYNGKANLYKIEKSRLDLQSAQMNVDYTLKELSLKTTTAKNNLVATYQSYRSSLKSLEFAANYQRLIERGFKEGVNSFIEDLDARNLLTSAQLQVNINQYKVLIAAANVEREISPIK